MSTPTSRRPARGATQSPSTSLPASQPIRTPDRTPSSAEPKTEYLRSALEARRAKNALATPASVEPRPAPPQRIASSTVISTTPSIDPWLNQALSEEDMQHAPPIRRGSRSRRPSESGLARQPTQREQQAELEAMKAKMFSMSLQLELVKKQNNELKDNLDEANHRVEHLESLEDENFELREVNNEQTLKLQSLDEEVAELDDKNRELVAETRELEKKNRDLVDANKENVKITEEIWANMEKLQGAVEEAADMIIELQNEKKELEEEVTRLKSPGVSNGGSIANSSHYQDGLDGHNNERYPARIHSIDDSRPSTSHFDSDYYSQPGSPQVRIKPAKEKQSYVERANNFLEVNIDSKRSMVNLKKRLSNASIISLPRAKSPSPEVPTIAEGYDDTPHEARPLTSLARTPGRRQGMMYQQLTPLNTTRHSSRRVTGVPPKTPTTPGTEEGLRGLFRVNQAMERDSGSSPSYKSPIPSYRSRVSTKGSPSVVAPQRDSSRFAHTSSSERLKNSSSEELQSETAPSEYPDSVPPPPSVVTDDLISHPDKDKWWKNTSGYRSANTHAHGALVALAGGSKNSRPSGNTDFDLFNGAETEDEFLRRANAYMPKRK